MTFQEGDGYISKKAIVLFIGIISLVVIWYIFNTQGIENIRASIYQRQNLEYEDSKHFEKKIIHKICPLFVCETCGMGNSIFHFASAYGLALYLNMTLVISKQDVLTGIFQISDHKDIKILKSRKLCEKMEVVEERYGCCTYDNQFKRLNQSTDYGIKNFLFSWRYFHGFEDELRKQLIFKKMLLSYARAFIRNTVLKHGFQSRSDAVVVGIHVRRGDMVAKHKKGYNVATKEYFHKAINWFSTRFNTTLLFIIATNDVTWTQRNIILSKDLKHFKFELINVRKSSAKVDFAIISNCDHVIMSVGTFGWWAAWLSSGIVTYYKWPAEPNTSVGSQYNKNFTDFFYPHWIGFS